VAGAGILVEIVSAEETSRHLLEVEEEDVDEDVGEEEEPHEVVEHLLERKAGVVDEVADEPANVGLDEEEKPHEVVELVAEGVEDGNKREKLARRHRSRLVDLLLGEEVKAARVSVGRK